MFPLLSENAMSSQSELISFPFPESYLLPRILTGRTIRGLDTFQWRKDFPSPGCPAPCFFEDLHFFYSYLIPKMFVGSIFIYLFF